MPVPPLVVVLGETDAAGIDAAVKSSTADIVAVLDAGAAVSPGFLGAAAAAVRRRPDTIVHPRRAVGPHAEARPSASARPDWRDVVTRDPWPGAAVVARELLVRHPLHRPGPPRDAASARWDWNARTAAAGVRHAVVAGEVVLDRDGATTPLLSELDLPALQSQLPVAEPRSLTGRVRRRLGREAARLRRRLPGRASDADGDDRYAWTLAFALRDIGDRAGALLVTPWLDTGHAHTGALDVARALQASPQFAGRTTILGTDEFARTVHIVIPGAIRYAHLDVRWLSMPESDRSRLLAQLVVLLHPELVVAVDDPHLAGALAEHGDRVAAATRVQLAVFGDQPPAAYPAEALTGVLAAEDGEAELLAEAYDGVAVLPLPIAETTPELPRGTRAYQNEYFSARNPFRVLAPAGPAVAGVAAELGARGLPVEVVEWDPPARGERADLSEAGTYGFHALLVVDTPPAALLVPRALLRGLPVVAVPGAAPGVLADGRTGLLAEDAAGLAAAVARLVDSVELRRDLIEAGYAATVERHGREAFEARVVAL